MNVRKNMANCKKCNCFLTNPNYDLCIYCHKVNYCDPNHLASHDILTDNEYIDIFWKNICHEIIVRGNKK